MLMVLFSFKKNCTCAAACNFAVYVTHKEAKAMHFTVSHKT